MDLFRITHLLRVRVLGEFPGTLSFWELWVFFVSSNVGTPHVPGPTLEHVVQFQFFAIRYIKIVPKSTGRSAKDHIYL